MINIYSTQVIKFLFVYHKKQIKKRHLKYDDVNLYTFSVASPKEVYPFAETGGGDMFCFYYEDDKAPIVVSWNHEHGIIAPEETTEYLCDSFTEFLDMLFICDLDDL